MEIRTASANDAQALFEAASTRNARSCHLLTGASNLKAQAFYEQMGYRRANEWMYRKQIR